MESHPLVGLCIKIDTLLIHFLRNKYLIIDLAGNTNQRFQGAGFFD